MADSSLAARRWGIRPGMPLAEAESLIPRSCPLRLVADDPAADRESLIRLGGWCQRFTPWVALEASDRPESLFLEVTGSAHLWKTEQRLVESILKELQSYRLLCRAALAESIGGAWGIAHWGDLTPYPSYSASYVDARSKEPLRASSCSAYRIAAMGKMKDEVLSLPVDSLRLAPATLALLAELGIEQVGSLESIPRASLASRLGEEALVRLDQALGRAEEILTPIGSSTRIERRMIFEYPLSQQAFLLDRVDELLAQAVHELPPGHGFSQLRVELVPEEGFAASVFELGSCRPTTSSFHWRELLRLSLDRRRLDRPTEEIRLVIASSVPFEWREQTLFPDAALRSAEGEQHWEELIDRLSSRLGESRVARARWVADAQPERSFAWMPAIDASRRKRASANFWPQAWRPLRLWNEPIRIDVRSVVPGGRPVWLRHPQGQDSVLQSWGPERIETGWWRTGAIARDYFRVELATGHRLWIFQDRSSHQWFLHGAFD